MKTLAQVQGQLRAGEFDYSQHAFRRAVERNISEQEIREAGAGLSLSRITRKISMAQHGWYWDSLPRDARSISKSQLPTHRKSES